MNITLIFAGGTGVRMNTQKGKPKQFLELYGKPVIIHTIENFEYHEEIDEIVVVCLESWIKPFKQMLKHYDITKVRSVIAGGATGQESIFLGLKEIEKLLITVKKNDDNPTILIHDAVRPFISENLITRSIENVKQYRSSVTVTSFIETAIQSEDNVIKKTIARDTIKVAKAPQCFHFQDIYSAHKQANEECVTGFVDSATLMLKYGYNLHAHEDSESNIKITTPLDYFIAKALYEAKENSQIFGF